MSKHQEADQARAIAGRYVDDHGLKFQPAMLPESMQRQGVSDAVKETANALKNMTDDKRAGKLGIKVKAYHIIAERRRGVLDTSFTWNALIAIDNRLTVAGVPVHTVYVHPSMPNQYLVYVHSDYLVLAGKAMMGWLADPNTPHGATFSIQPIAD